MKLPEIIYGPVEKLGRYGSKAPSIIAKTGEVKASGIRAAAMIKGQGIRNSSAILSQAIENAGTKQARGEYEAAKNLNDTRARHTYEAQALDIKSDLAINTAITNAVTGLAQTGIEVGARWYAAEQASKATKSESLGKTQMRGITNHLGRSHMVNLDDPMWAEYTTSYKGPVDLVPDPNTGQMVRMAPTEKVSGEIQAQAFSKIMKDSLSEVDGDLHRDELELKLTNWAAEQGLILSKANDGYRLANMSASYLEAYDVALSDGRYGDADTIAADAYSIGAWKPDFYQSQVKNVRNIKKSDDFTTEIRSMTAIGEKVPSIDDLFSRILNSNLPNETSLLNSLKVKESGMKSEAKQFKKEKEDTVVDLAVSEAVGKFNIDGVKVSDLVQAGQDRLDKMGITGRGSDVRTKIVGEWNVYESQRFEVKNNNNIDWTTDYFDERASLKPLPAEATPAMKAMYAARRDGKPIETDWGVHGTLDAMSKGTRAEKIQFAELDINGDYGHKLSEPQRRDMLARQETVRAEITDGEDTIKDIDLKMSDDMFKQEVIMAFGPDTGWNDEKRSQANELNYVAGLALNQKQKELGRMLTSQEKSDTIKGLFQNQVSIYKPSVTRAFGGASKYKPGTAAPIFKTDFKRSVDDIGSFLVTAGHTVDANNISSTYNFVYKTIVEQGGKVTEFNIKKTLDYIAAQGGDIGL